MQMSLSEEVPLLDSVAHPLANALEFAFGCHHTGLSRVFTIKGRTYKVCLECGATFDYSLRNMEVVHRRRFLPALMRLRRRRRFLRKQNLF
jgi:hypothetical protein